MTADSSAMLLTLDTSATGRHTVRIALNGDLDYETAATLLDEATRQLELHPDLRHLRLDCAGLGACDSMGLSILLGVRRRTDAAGVRLHLDRRSARLERLLTVTGTLAHLIGIPGAAGATGATGATRVGAGRDAADAVGSVGAVGAAREQGVPGGDPQ